MSWISHSKRPWGKWEPPTLLAQRKTQSERRLACRGSSLIYLLFTYKLCIIFFSQLETLNDSLDRWTRQKKMHKNREALKNILNWHNLIDTDQTLHPTMAEYTIFSNARETITKINHMLGHKRSLNKFQKIEILQSIFSDHDGLSWKSLTKIICYLKIK